MQNIKAVIGIIFKKDKVLLSSRTKNQFMAGFWEFAGGKIEKNESQIQALAREFFEELDIQIIKAEFLKKITHTYPDKKVDLSVFIIKKYSGKILAKEGQEVKWVNIANVEKYKILPTVRPLLNFATLPKIYWITPDNHYDISWWIKLKIQINKGVKLIQLRSKTKLKDSFIKKVYDVCQINGVKLMLNIPNFSKHSNGYHLTSSDLINTEIKQYNFMSASAHNLSDLKKAEKLGFDFVLISPVLPTTSHPNTKPIGFSQAETLAKQVNIPVYFLGGMKEKHLKKAITHGAIGIAGISLI